MPSATPSPSATPTSVSTVSATAVPPTRTAIPSTGKLAPLITRGTSAKLVALTFDLGGKDAGTTAHVLDTLKAYGFHATFFLTGEWTAVNPALVRRMVAEGHELANHTYDHPRLTEVPPDQIRTEVTRTEAVIVKAAGVGPKRYLRPPFGSYDLTVRIVLGQMGYEMVWWTVDSGDWRSFTPEQIVERADTLKAGDIFVAHAYAANTGQAIEGICQAIKAKGLTGGTLSRALGR